MEKIKLRGHHIAMFGEWLNDLKADGIEEEYGKENTKFTDNLYSSLLNNPILQVIFVSGLDDICNANCPIKEVGCEKPQSPLDSLCLKEYGFEEGVSYTSAEVVQKLREFPKKNNLIFASPRKEYFLV